MAESSEEKYKRIADLLVEARLIAGTLPVAVEHMTLCTSITQAKAVALMLRDNPNG